MKLYNSKEYLVEQLKTKDYLQIAKENNIGTSTIHRWLNKFELTNPSDTWTDKEIELLKENYYDGEKLFTLFPDRTKSSIYHKANRLGFGRIIKPRKHKVNENFFNEINSESAYVLGWMFSDGNVQSHKATFRIHLNKKDIKIMETIRELLKSEHPFYFGKINDVELKIHSSKLCKKLIEFGCVPRKSWCLEFPTNMPDEHLSHFMRGFFDGDGSIMFNKPNVIKISILGTTKFLEILKNKLLEIPQVKSSNIKRTSTIWKIEMYGDNARRFCEWIYKDCGQLYLERKFERFQKHMEKREQDYGIKTSNDNQERLANGSGQNC